jgi:glycosyltransferase involved in cell wall biosynthesis
VRIVQVIDELRLAGGAERLQVSFADAVRGKDVDVTVLTLHENELAAEQELEALGVHVVPFPARRFADVRRAARMARYLREQHFDVLHTHLVRSTILAIPAARAAGIPTVATLHNMKKVRGRRRWLGPMESWVLRHLTNRVISVGWETARVHGERLGNRQIDVIPNGVAPIATLEPPERQAIRRELGVPEGTPLLLAVGRLNKDKGHSDLFRSLLELGAGPDAPHLRIAGMGGYEETLQAEIEAMGLSGRVQLLGLRRDVPRLLAASDVYVSGSLTEALPVATLEAMAAGLPIVATDVGDVARVVTKDVGVLVPAGDPLAIAAALRETIASPSLRASQSAAGRARVSEHFCSKVWATRHLDLYRELGQRNGTIVASPVETRECA